MDYCNAALAGLATRDLNRMSPLSTSNSSSAQIWPREHENRTQTQIGDRWQKLHGSLTAAMEQSAGRTSTAKHHIWHFWTITLKTFERFSVQRRLWLFV